MPVEERRWATRGWARLDGIRPAVRRTAPGPRVPPAAAGGTSARPPTAASTTSRSGPWSSTGTSTTVSNRDVRRAGHLGRLCLWRGRPLDAVLPRLPRLAGLPESSRWPLPDRRFRQSVPANLDWARCSTASQGLILIYRITPSTTSPAPSPSSRRCSSVPAHFLRPSTSASRTRWCTACRCSRPPCSCSSGTARGGDRTVAQWAWMGAAAGLMAMKVRWPNILFLVVPAMPGLVVAWRTTPPADRAKAARSRGCRLWRRPPRGGVAAANILEDRSRRLDQPSPWPITTSSSGRSISAMSSSRRNSRPPVGDPPRVPRRPRSPPVLPAGIGPSRRCSSWDSWRRSTSTAQSTSGGAARLTGPDGSRVARWRSPWDWRACSTGCGVEAAGRAGRHRQRPGLRQRRVHARRPAWPAPRQRGRVVRSATSTRSTSRVGNPFSFPLNAIVGLEVQRRDARLQPAAGADLQQRDDRPRRGRRRAVPRAGVAQPRTGSRLLVPLGDGGSVGRRSAADGVRRLPPRASVQPVRLSGDAGAAGRRGVLERSRGRHDRAGPGPVQLHPPGAGSVRDAEAQSDPLPLAGKHPRQPLACRPTPGSCRCSATGFASRGS